MPSACGAVRASSPSPGTAGLSAFIPAAGDAAQALDKYGRDVPLAPVTGGFTVDLPPATHNTDTRDRSIYLVGGDPLIVVQDEVAADAPPLRAVDACFGAPGLDVPGWSAPTGYHVS